MLFRCKLGPAQPNIQGVIYDFARDKHGRYVANVLLDKHIACFAALDTYEAVDEDPEPAKVEEPAPPAPAPAPAPTPQPAPAAAPPPATPPAAAPAPGPATPGLGDGSQPAPQQDGFKDDIGLIKGIGAKVRVQLEGIGVASLRQIAAWTPEDVARIDSELGLKGSIERYGWVEQAKAWLPEAPAAE